jgi:FAD/FMN-containing dehydrogenase
MNASAPQPLVFHARAGRDIAARLAKVVAGDVLTDAASCARYATDASIYQVQPLAVLVPATDDDVRAAMDICARRACQSLRRRQLPVRTDGGRRPRHNYTASIARIMAVDRPHRHRRPGIVLDALNAWLRPHGLWFPVDVSTSAQATLGGMAGNNSCGSRSIAYGNMVHNVVAIDALLADGTEARFGDAAAMAGAPPRVRELLAALDAIGARERGIARVVPRVRRVGRLQRGRVQSAGRRP